LTDTQLADLDELSARIPVEGGRYPEHLEAQTNL
jgi:hypothetical protein